MVEPAGDFESDTAVEGSDGRYRAALSRNWELLLIDVLGWPAAMSAHTGDPPFIAPTIEMSARFHRLDPSSEWLLAVVDAPIASEGLIGSTATIWSRDGKLIASGGQHMLSRPLAR